jgi:hypothetical protein
MTRSLIRFEHGQADQRNAAFIFVLPITGQIGDALVDHRANLRTLRRRGTDGIRWQQRGREDTSTEAETAGHFSDRIHGDSSKKKAKIVLKSRLPVLESNVKLTIADLDPERYQRRIRLSETWRIQASGSAVPCADFQNRTRSGTTRSRQRDDQPIALPQAATDVVSRQVDAEKSKYAGELEEIVDYSQR